MARKQQEKSRQTMEELMASAMRLFGEKGFVETTVAEITSRAGYAKGSFYRHFSSKDELFLAIVEQKLMSYRQARDTRIKKAESLDEAMNVIWDFLEAIIEDRDWATIFLEFTVHAARNEELKKKMNKGVYRLSNEIFADLVKDHVDSGYPPGKIGALNTAIFEGFLVHCALGTGTLTKEDVREAALALARRNGIART